METKIEQQKVRLALQKLGEARVALVGINTNYADCVKDNIERLYKDVVHWENEIKALIDKSIPIDEEEPF